MSMRLKRSLAAFLAGAILLAGSGFGSTFAAGIEHGLGIESSLFASPAEGSDSGKKCEHGCAGHFTAHLVTLIDAQLPLVPAATAAMQSATPAFGVIAARPDSFFRPPRTSLA